MRKTFDSSFPVIMFVVLMKNFEVVDCKMLTAESSFRTFEPKKADSIFFDIIYIVFMKNFDHINWKILMPFGSFWSSCDQNIWFQLSNDRVRRVHEKYWCRWLEENDGRSGEASPTILVMQCKFFCVYRPYKESISKEKINDNDLNLHSMTKLSGWLRYWTAVSSFLSLEPKTLDCNFFVINYVVLMKNFDHIIGRILRPCGSFWPPCDQNIWFQLSSDHVRRVYEKFWCLEPKNTWFHFFLTSFTSCSWKILIVIIGTILLPFGSFWFPCAQNLIPAF